MNQVKERLDTVQIYSGQSTLANAETNTPFTVVWLNSAEEIPGQLWDRCFPPSLEGQWWYKTLEQSKLENQFKFFYGLVYINGNASGIVPLFLMDLPLELVAPDFMASAIRLVSKKIPSLGFQKTLFVGSPCADEGTVGFIKGVELADVALHLQECLEVFAKDLGAKMIVWKDFNDKDVPALATLAVSKKLFKVVSFPGTTIATPACNLSEYLQSLQSNVRYRIKKKLKKSEQMGRLNVSVIKNSDSNQLNEIMSLFFQTYERGKTKFERLDQEFFEQIAKHEVSSFLLLRTDDGRLAAFSLNFQLEDKVINKFLGLDYSMDKNWFLYFRLWAETFEWVLSTGAREYQSGQTGYRPKLDLGNRLIPLTNYSKHLNLIVNAIFSVAAKTVSWSTLDDDLKTYLKAHPEMQLNTDFSQSLDIMAVQPPLVVQLEA